MNSIDFCDFSGESFQNLCRELLVMDWFVESSHGVEHFEFYCLWIDVIELQKSDFSV